VRDGPKDEISSMPKQNLIWVRIAIGCLAGLLLWFMWQESIKTSPELESIKLRFFLSEAWFGQSSAAVAFKSGLGRDYTVSTNLGFLPLGAIFGVVFSILRPFPRFILWAIVTVEQCIVAQVCFEVWRIIIPFGGPLVLINCCYICGTLIHLETEKIERSRNLALDLQIQAEQERKRIAKDLHDEALPSLSRVMRLADQLHGEYADNPIPEEIRSRLESTVSEMRRVINDLHPAVLENLGLSASLQHLVDKFAHESKVHVTFRDETQGLNLPPFPALCIYRIAQETLNNVEKHAAASQTEVSLEMMENVLHLRISDNGNGELRRKPDSYGLKNIEDRARLIGAKLEWKAPAKYPSGTMLVLTVPLNTLRKQTDSGNS
jgi:signal transduction histidine kinase